MNTDVALYKRNDLGGYDLVSEGVPFTVPDDGDYLMGYISLSAEGTRFLKAEPVTNGLTYVYAAKA